MSVAPLKATQTLSAEKISLIRSHVPDHILQICIGDVSLWRGCSDRVENLDAWMNLSTRWCTLTNKVKEVYALFEIESDYVRLIFCVKNGTSFNRVLALFAKGKLIKPEEAPHGFQILYDIYYMCQLIERGSDSAVAATFRARTISWINTYVLVIMLHDYFKNIAK